MTVKELNPEAQTKRLPRAEREPKQPRLVRNKNEIELLQQALISIEAVNSAVNEDTKLTFEMADCITHIQLVINEIKTKFN